jgi:hypothetical protein
MLLLLLLVGAVRGGSPLDFETYKVLYSLNVVLGRLPSVLETRSDFLLLNQSDLGHLPMCPNSANSSFFHCDDAAQVVFLRIESTRRAFFATPISGQFNMVRLPALRDLEVFNVGGRLLLRMILGAPQLRRIDIRHSFLNEHTVGNETLAMMFFDATDELHVYNTTIAGVALPSTPPARLPTVCNFTNVRLVCPLPQWLSACVSNSASVACLSNEALFNNSNWPGSVGFSKCGLWAPVSQPCAATCSVPSMDNSDCFAALQGHHVALTPGLVSAELSFGQIGALYSVDVSMPRTVGLVAKIEAWNWTSDSYTTLFEQFPPPRRMQDLTLSNVFTYWVEPTLTSRIRLTWESLLPSDQLGKIMARFIFNGTTPPQMPPLPINCAKPVLLGPRASLDDTIADSYCVGRVCQDACGDGVAPTLVTNVSVGVPVVPVFVVIVGGSGWANGGTPVAEPSAGTRVYAISGGAPNATTLSLSGGVRNATRVRVVSERTASDLGASANATIESTQVHRLLTGRLVQRRRANVTYSGAVVVARDVWPTNGQFAGSASAKFDAQNASVLAVSATTSVALVYGEGRDGSTDRWQRFDAARNEWTEIVSPLRVLYVNQSTAVATAIAQRRRVLAHVAASGGSGGLVVVVGASATELYDGSRNGSLAGRRAVQTPVDLYDVARNLWIVGTLEHGFDKRMSELDVMVVNGTTTTATVVVMERANGSSSFEMEWRPYTTLLRECSEQSACDTCMHTDETLDVCKWCQGQCVPRFATCPAEECLTGTMTTNFTGTTSATSSMLLSSTESTITAESTTSGSAAIATTSDSSSGLSSGTVIAIAVPVAIVGVLLLGAVITAIVVMARRRRQTSTESSTEMTADTKQTPSDQRYETGDVAKFEEPLPAEQDGESHSVSLSE